MVAAVVIVLVASVVRAVAGVPDVRKLRHRGGLLLVDLLQEPGVNRPAVAAHAAVVEVKRLGNQTLVACHDVCQVAQRLRCVPVCPDVDVYPASPAGIALRACVAELADKLLQGFDVPVAEDGRHQFTLFAVRPRDGNVLLEFPLASVAVPSRPGAVSVAARRVLASARSEEVGGNLRCLFPRDAVHLDLNPDGLVLKVLNLACCFLCHGGILRFRFGVFSLSVVTYSL